MSGPVKWPTKEELPNLPRMSIFDLLKEPISAVGPGADDVVEFKDVNGSWNVVHTDKHGFVKVWNAI